MIIKAGISKYIVTDTTFGDIFMSWLRVVDSSCPIIARPSSVLINLVLNSSHLVSDIIGATLKLSSVY